VDPAPQNQYKAPESAEQAPQGPTNPYRAKTKMFAVADRLLSGETDQGKIARELGVSLKTVHNTASDLKKHGYTLKVDVGKAFPASHPPPHLLPRIPE
jgi:biotin operon repressor